MNRDQIDKSYKKMLNLFTSYKKDASFLNNLQTASIVIDRHKVVGQHTLGGIHIKHFLKDDYLHLKIEIDPYTKIDNPVHICFGVTSNSFKQRIKSQIVVGKSAYVRFLSHCIFPEDGDVIHEMYSKYIVKQDAYMEYNEEHFHSSVIGAKVYTTTDIILKERAEYVTDFAATQTKIGEIILKYNVDVFKDASFTNTLRGYLREHDIFKTDESVNLIGKNSKAIIRSKMAVLDGAYAKFGGTISASGDYAKGHIECSEIMVDNARVEAVPKLNALNKTVRLTHEASLGTVNEDELLNLMSKGLSRDEAVDLIIRGKIFNKV